MPAARIGPYRILRPIGEGGMGTVYEAVHESIERRVALKVLHPEYARSPEAVTRFFNEARAVNRIEHPNIVQVSEFGRADDGTVYLVMEFLRGETLSRRLETLAAAGRRIRPVEAVQIGAQLADALAEAHEKGIVHRDMKPSNVMLVADTLSPSGERVKLLDFGIAKLTQGSGGKATKTNALMGTPQYMSPEQCRGAGGVDDRTDVYALGVMLYELLAGRPPFVAEEAIAYLGLHAYQPPPPLANFAPQTPAEFTALVHRLLAKDKAARPAMRDVRGALLQLLSQLSGATKASVSGEWAPTRRSASAIPASTLGGSLGQTVRSRPIQRKVIFIAAMLGILVATGLAGRLLLKPAKSVPAAVVQPVPLPRTDLPPNGSLKPGEPPKQAEAPNLAHSPKSAQLPGLANLPMEIKPVKPADSAPLVSLPAPLPLVPGIAGPHAVAGPHRPPPNSILQNSPRSRPAVPANKPPSGQAPAVPSPRPRKFVD